MTELIHPYIPEEADVHTPGSFHLSDSIHQEPLSYTAAGLQLLPRAIVEATYGSEDPEVREYAHENMRTIARGVLIKAGNDRALEHAKTDPVTGLKGRVAFEQDYPSVFSRDPNLGVAYIDLNGLNRVNDLDGLHAAGDRYLRTVASALEEALRPGDLLYRIGGDEFAIMISNISKEDMRAILERLRTVSAKAIEGANIPADSYPGVSIGGAIRKDDDTRESLVMRADVECAREKEEFYKVIEKRTGLNLRRSKRRSANVTDSPA